jgi:hypothetical protein
MKTVTTWWAEIALAAGAIWTALGTSGQNGLINLAATEAHKLPWAAAGIAVVSVVVARLRSAPAPTPSA